MSVMKMSATIALEEKVTVTVSAAAENLAIAVCSDVLFLDYIYFFTFYFVVLGLDTAAGFIFNVLHISIVYFIIYMCGENCYSSLMNIIGELTLFDQLGMTHTG